MIWRLPCVSRTETLFPYTPGCRAVEAGLANWSDGEPGGMLIVRGQAKLLEDVTAVTDLEHIRALFEALEKKEALLRLIDAADGAEGVQIFIGTDNELFTLAGCSMLIAPFAKLGSASGRERLCQYVYIPLAARSL